MLEEAMQPINHKHWSESDPCYSKSRKDGKALIMSQTL